VRNYYIKRRFSAVKLLAASSILACYRRVRSRAPRVHKQTWLSDYTLLIIISLFCAEFNGHLLVIPPGPYHAIMPRCCHQRMPLHFVFRKKVKSCVWWFTLCVQYAQAKRWYFKHKVNHHTQYACIRLVWTTTHNMKKLHKIDHSLCACNTSVNHALEAEWEVQGRDIYNVGADDDIRSRLACGVWIRECTTRGCGLNSWQFVSTCMQLQHIASMLPPNADQAFSY
jgi:hypothetical protein